MGGSSNTTQFPEPSQEEKDLQKKQLELLQQQEDETNAFKPLLLSQFGLEADYGHRDPTSEQTTAYNNQEATLRANIASAQASGDVNQIIAAQSAWGDFVKNGLQGTEYVKGYKKTADQVEKDQAYNSLLKNQNEVTNLQLDRQKKALAGDLPISEGTTQRKTQEWALFKEQMARAGNPVFGDSPEEAFSTSTAGTQALKAFNANWKLVEDSERRGEITTGASLLNQSIGLSSGLRSDAIQTAGAIPDLGTGKLIPGYVGALQPYQFQRQGQFSANAANATANAQREAGMMSMVGNLAGSAAGLYALSSKKYKKNIKEGDDQGALSSLRKTKMFKFDFKDEKDKGEARHYGPIVEHSPKGIVSPDGEHIDVMNMIGMITSSIRALDKELVTLKGRKKEAA